MKQLEVWEQWAQDHHVSVKISVSQFKGIVSGIEVEVCNQKLHLPITAMPEDLPEEMEIKAEVLRDNAEHEANYLRDMADLLEQQARSLKEEGE